MMAAGQWLDHQPGVDFGSDHQSAAATVALQLLQGRAGTAQQVDGCGVGGARGARELAESGLHPYGNGRRSAHAGGPADLEAGHAAGPDGRGGGTAGRSRVPGLRRLVVRHRPRPDRGWRLHRLVTPPDFALPAPAGRTRAWGIKGELSLASPPPYGGGLARDSFGRIFWSNSRVFGAGSRAMRRSRWMPA